MPPSEFKLTMSDVEAVAYNLVDEVFERIERRADRQLGEAEIAQVDAQLNEQENIESILAGIKIVTP